MDALLKFMSDKNIANVLIEEILLDEQYDSDTIRFDVLENENGNNSNIREWTHNFNEYKLIYKYIYQIKCMFFYILYF